MSAGRDFLTTALRYRAGLVPAAVVALAIVSAALLFSSGSGESKPGLVAGDLRQPIHEHADWALFIRGTRWEFSDPKYLSDEKRELSPNAHIHVPRYTVVHVHREQTTWDEFLRSLGFNLTDATFGIEIEKTCMVLPSGESLCNGPTETFKFVVNGVRVDGVSLENIAGLSRVLISFGAETDDEVMAQYAKVTDEACIPSGLCQERGTGAGEHGEPCARASGQCN